MQKDSYNSVCLSSPRSLVSAIYEGLDKTSDELNHEIFFITGEINK